MDLMNFRAAFIRLGYKVIEYEEKKAKEIKSLMSNLMSKDHSQYDSFVFCISTHGEADHWIFGSDGKTVNIHELVKMSQNCLSLVGKPKLFFVQSCRVGPLGISTSYEELKCQISSWFLNSQADVFIAYATTPNHAAYHSKEHGSWFVTALHSVFMKPDLMELTAMIRQVNDRVCQLNGFEQFSGTIVHQCIESRSTLRKDVYFEFRCLPLPSN